MTGGHIIREKSAGVLEFSGEFIVFREKPSNKLKRYRFIAYEQGLGGGTLLTLLTLLPEAQTWPRTWRYSLSALHTTREAAKK